MPYNADGNWIDREFKEYRSKAGDREVTVEAHEVTNDTQGEVLVAGQVAKQAKPGDYLLRTAAPDIYEVVTKGDFESFKAPEVASDVAEGDVDEEGPVVRPPAKKAAGKNAP